MVPSGPLANSGAAGFLPGLRKRERPTILSRLTSGMVTSQVSRHSAATDQRAVTGHCKLEMIGEYKGPPTIDAVQTVGAKQEMGT